MFILAHCLIHSTSSRSRQSWPLHPSAPLAALLAVGSALLEGEWLRAKDTQLTNWKLAQVEIQLWFNWSLVVKSSTQNYTRRLIHNMHGPKSRCTVMCIVLYKLLSPRGRRKEKRKALEHKQFCVRSWRREWEWCSEQRAHDNLKMEKTTTISRSNLIHSTKRKRIGQGGKNSVRTSPCCLLPISGLAQWVSIQLNWPIFVS